MVNKRNRLATYALPQNLDYFELVPEWSEKAACIGRWKEFDKDDNDMAAIVCWNECPVRKECLIYTLRMELKSNRVEGDLMVTGVAGGYTAAERRVMHEAIMQDEFYIDEV